MQPRNRVGLVGYPLGDVPGNLAERLPEYVFITCRCAICDGEMLLPYTAVAESPADAEPICRECAHLINVRGALAGIPVNNIYAHKDSDYGAIARRMLEHMASPQPQTVPLQAPSQHPDMTFLIGCPPAMLPPTLNTEQVLITGACEACHTDVVLPLEVVEEADPEATVLCLVCGEVAIRYYRALGGCEVETAVADPQAITNLLAHQRRSRKAPQN